MKLKIIIAFILAPCFAFAQETGWKFSVNFDPGIHWASITENKSHIKSEGSRAGFDLSLHAEKYFKERYAFYAGLSFLNTGFKIENVSDADFSFKADNFTLSKGNTGKVRAQYITIPVGMKFRTPQIGPLAYYFSAGIFPAINVGGDFNIGGTKYDFKKDLNAITCGTKLGVGAMYPTGDNTYLTAGLSFHYMFVDVASASNIKAMPMGIGLSMGFLF